MPPSYATSVAVPSPKSDALHMGEVMFKKILLPFDGSPTAAAALPYASWLADALNADVEVVTVAPSRAVLRGGVTTDLEDDDIGVSILSQAAHKNVENAHGAARERASTIASTVAQSLRVEGLIAESRVIEGDPAESILTIANESAGTLIVISTHGRSGPQRWMLGSVTDKVIRNSATPVLVTTAHDGTHINAIVVPLDGSEWAEHSLPHAEHLAKRMSLPIHLVRSVSLASMGYGLIEDGPAQYADLAESTESLAHEYMEEIADRVRKNGVEHVEISITNGPTDAAIVDEIGVDGDKLTVMTSHGRSGINRWVLGSVADRVIRHGAGPVLLVPSKN